MRRTLQRVTAAGLVVAAATLGCNKQLVREKNPPDPLLVSKKPVEGRQSDQHGPVATAIPQPPPLPYAATATVEAPSDTAPLPPAKLLGLKPLPPH
jgi:hypothetical protein